MFMAVIQRFSVARLVMLMTAILMVSGQAQAVTSKKAKIKIAEEATSIVIDERAEVGLNPAVGVLAYPSRTLRVSLKSLGAAQPLVLRGVQGDASVDLSVRLDELVERAQLHLSLTLSPALIPYLSHVKVFLNDEVLHTIAVDKDKLGVPIPVDLALNPKYFKDFNKLRFQLIGHYILECEFPFHSSLWAEISNESYVDLQLRQLPLANDLSILPAPFFDSRDSTEQIVPFV
ncbi:cellulose biosynthesis cyclic di-GMP-binding regulatory protein BcsB, partial [Rhodoferax sp.]